MKILLVEDDESLASLLIQLLKMQHYQVDLATDGQTGWELATAFSYDLLLLDVMLPVLDGISFCQQWRTAGDLTPILFLTALDLSKSKVTGLDAGADDYVVKPFNPDELLARIRALLRRGHPASLPVMQWGNVQLDPSSCQVTCDRQSVHLTSKEYELLELFLRNPHRIFSSSVLLDRLWSVDELPTESTVRSHIKGLRRKLAKTGAGDPIETIYALGYRLREETDKNSFDTEKTHEKATVKARVNHAAETPLTRAIPDHDLFSADSVPGSLKLSELWQLHQEKYLNCVSMLEETIAALQQDCLSHEQWQQTQQQAQQYAHTLAGALGSFGFDLASHLSRYIEQTFTTRPSPDAAQVQQLATWVKQLRLELLSPTAATERLNGGEAIDRPLHLLIVDHNVELAATLATEASEWGMLATTATQLDRARAIINQILPDVIALNLNFPDSPKHELDFLAELSTDSPPIPTIVLVAPENLVSLKEAKDQGMDFAHWRGQKFLQKPVSFTQIMEATKQILNTPSHPVPVG